MTTNATPVPPMVPVDVVVSVTEDGAQNRVTVYGQATTCNHLVITPGFHDGQIVDKFCLTHVPTGFALCFGSPHELREIAARIAHLDWAAVTPENFPGSDTATEAATIIRSVQFTDPSAVELPAHDAWGADGTGQGLKRAALPLAQDILADLQRAMGKTWGEGAVPLDVPDPDSPRGVRINPEWTFWIFRMVHDFGLSYLLLVLHRLDREVADSAAAFLADTWEAGDSTGEWAWQWHQALLKGQTPELPGVPQLGELFGGGE